MGCCQSRERGDQNSSEPTVHHSLAYQRAETPSEINIHFPGQNPHESTDHPPPVYHSPVPLEERRVVLIGKTGNGKSSTINQVFGRKAVLSTVSSSSGTKKSEYAQDTVGGKRLVMIDTPGLYDTDTPEAETKREIEKVIGLSSPGFHAFLLVLKIGARYTKEEHSTVEILAGMFGEQVYRRAIIIFSAVDQLEFDGMTFDHYRKCELPPKLREVISNCGDRVVGFDNRATGKEHDSQVEQLMLLIEDVVRNTGDTYYTSQMFEEVARKIAEEKEKRLQQETEKTMADIEEEIRTEIQEETGFGTQILYTIEELASPVMIGLGKAMMTVLAAEIIQCSIS